mmetsp:Transcript_13022/g.27709  ORF Transcript_13022/g.27709 Transcript_13022/m.27709 type:complete len:391 (-) Transcript_13022:178-1350(-)
MSKFSKAFGFLVAASFSYQTVAFTPPSIENIVNILTNEPEGPPPDYIAEKALFQYKLERNDEKLKSMKEIMDMKNAEIEALKAEVSLLRNAFLGDEMGNEQAVLNNPAASTESTIVVATEKPAMMKEVIPSIDDGEATAEALEMARKARIAAAEAVKKAQQPPPPPSPPKTAPVVAKKLSELQAGNVAKTLDTPQKQANLTELLKSNSSRKNVVMPNANLPKGGSSLKDLVSGSVKPPTPKIEAPKPRSNLKDLVQSNTTPKNPVIANIDVPKGRSLKDILTVNSQSSTSAFPTKSFAKPSPTNNSKVADKIEKKTVNAGVEPTKPNSPYFFAHVPEEGKGESAWTKMESSKSAPSNDSIPLGSSKGERSFEKFAAAAEAFEGSGVGAVA